ncbi:MAG: 30S ribosomal protein S6 [Candidatus Wildermuthbacteria bacterium RIFCSPLOWO2_01_FULL_47_18]|uniref:Small ribosomal subunit protein bS6 n=2 Tax=Candidatus Wildermuthiibacteriota TaxID=1817923 RepID=A0A1G2RJ28_9BACT|nr:MAG: 30S ribosomal protein S6 [Candidatus Wildermuthbacteria bacterium RIFCSPHIGHO2_02_FULL_48_16]OHA72854.1 MAG: 30S ribosomal protein S6 [Candidatus Wildermuthbacteria bacterium RIFCSPLOWO2_01_FULL_47_18]
MNTYQLTILVNPEVQEDSLNAVLGRIAEAVQKLGGIVEQQDMQKKVQLAYPIQKQREAYRGLLTFAMDPKEVEAFQKLVQGQKEVLRFLLIVAPKVKVEIPTLAKASTKPVEEEKMSIEDIDKKLEEIFKEP